MIEGKERVQFREVSKPFGGGLENGAQLSGERIRVVLDVLSMASEQVIDPQLMVLQVPRCFHRYAQKI